MAMTPDQWLNRLAYRMDLRRPRLNLLRSYMDGDAPLPEGIEDCREAYQDFQKKARTNFGELVVEAVVERMRNGGFRVGDTTDDDDDARSIWRRNRLTFGAADIHRDMVGLGCGYAMVQDLNGSAAVTYERPEQAITEQDPLRPFMAQAGLKVFRDEVAGYDTAFLHVPGLVYTYNRHSIPVAEIFGEVRPIITVTGGWELTSVDETGLNAVPIVPFVNRAGRGEYEAHLDILDRINWTILQRLVITAMQAYRQRALKGDVPDKDEDGNDIDYGELFRPGPGSIWRLPDGVDLWESAQADLTPILESAKNDVTFLAGVTRTPMSMLMPEQANQSAEGAAFAREGLVFKAEDRIARAGAAWETVMGLALALERGASEPLDDLNALWMPVERQSLTERADAASKAQDLPWRDRMTDIWQFDGDRVDRMEANRMQDALVTGMAAPPQPVQPPAQPSAQPTDAAPDANPAG